MTNLVCAKNKKNFSDSEEENQNSDTTNSDEDSDGLEIRLDFQPIPLFGSANQIASL